MSSGSDVVRDSVERDSGMPFVPVITSVHQSVGSGCRALVWVALRSTPRASVGKDYRLLAKDNSLCQTAIPSWALRGEKLQSFGAGPGGQGSRPQVSRQWKHWKSQTTHSVSGPGRPAARVSGQCCANHLPGFRWDLTSIYQPAREPPPTAPSAPTFAKAPARTPNAAGAAVPAWPGAS